VRIREGHAPEAHGVAQYRARAAQARVNDPTLGQDADAVRVDKTKVSAAARELSEAQRAFDESKVDRLRDVRAQGGLVAEPAAIAARILQEP